VKAEVIESLYNIKRKSYCHPTTSQLFCPKPDQCRSVHSFGRSVGLFFFTSNASTPVEPREQAFSVRSSRKVLHQPLFLFLF